MVMTFTSLSLVERVLVAPLGIEILVKETMVKTPFSVSRSTALYSGNRCCLMVLLLQFGLFLCDGILELAEGAIATQAELGTRPIPNTIHADAGRFRFNGAKEITESGVKWIIHIFKSKPSSRLQ